MWVLHSDRKILTDILLDNSIPSSLEYKDADNLPNIQIDGDNLYLIWKDDPRETQVLPSVIIVANGHLRDFFAWVLTYFPNYRPFSAFFRVFEYSALSSLSSWLAPPSLRGIESACVGLIIAETYSLSRSSEIPVAMTVGNCSNTVSYILARAASLGADDKQIDNICERWSLIRQITHQPGRKLSANDIKSIYQIPFSMSLKTQGHYERGLIDKNIYKSCSEIKNDGRISEVTWHVLTNNIGILKNAHQQMASTREERVRYFQEIIAENTISKVYDESIRAFIYGYLASMIAPGSLSHIELLLRLSTSLPSTILWYGLCAGLQKKNEIMTSYQCLGRRLLRELLRHEPLLSSPTSDLMYEEFQLLIQISDNLIDFPAYLSARTFVDIQPCISTEIRWFKGESKQQSELSSKANSLIQQEKLLHDLGVSLMHALDIHKKLSGTEQIKPPEPKRHHPRQNKKQSEILLQEGKK